MLESIVTLKYRCRLTIDCLIYRLELHLLTLVLKPELASYNLIRNRINQNQKDFAETAVLIVSFSFSTKCIGQYYLHFQILLFKPQFFPQNMLILIRYVQFWGQSIPAGSIDLKNTISIMNASQNQLKSQANYKGANLS